MNEAASDWHVRAFSQSDIEPVLALWSSIDGLGKGPGDSSEELTRFLHRNPGLSLVATCGDRIVAAILCGHDGRRGFMYRLAVVDDYRRRGIAEMMVERCLEGLETAGVPRCLVFVLADNNPALRFWQAVGAKMRDELQILSLEVGRG